MSVNSHKRTLASPDPEKVKKARTDPGPDLRDESSKDTNDRPPHPTLSSEQTSANTTTKRLPSSPSRNTPSITKAGANGRTERTNAKDEQATGPSMGVKQIKRGKGKLQSGFTMRSAAASPTFINVFRDVVSAAVKMEYLKSEEARLEKELSECTRELRVFSRRPDDHPSAAEIHEGEKGKVESQLRHLHQKLSSVEGDYVRQLHQLDSLPEPKIVDQLASVRNDIDDCLQRIGELNTQSKEWANQLTRNSSKDNEAKKFNGSSAEMETKIDSLFSELATLKVAITSSDKRKVPDEEEVAQLKSSLEAVRAETTSLCLEVSDLKTKAQSFDVRHEIDQHDKRLITLEDKDTHPSDTLTQLEARIGAVSSTIALVQSRLVALESRNAELDSLSKRDNASEKELQEAKEGVERLTTSVQSIQKKHLEDYRRLLDQNDTKDMIFMEEVQNNETKFERVQRLVRDLEARQVADGKSIADLKIQFAAQEKQNQDLRQQQADFHTTIPRLESEINALKGDLTSKAEEIQGLKQKNEGLHSTVQRIPLLEADIDALKKELATQQTTRAKMDQSLEALKVATQQLESRYNNLYTDDMVLRITHQVSSIYPMRQLEQGVEEVKAIHRDLSVASSNYSGLETRVAGIETSHSNLNSKLSDLEESRNTVKSELDDIKSSYLTLDKDIKGLGSRIEECEYRGSKTNQRIDEHARTTKELKQLCDELEGRFRGHGNRPDAANAHQGDTEELRTRNSNYNQDISRLRKDIIDMGGRFTENEDYVADQVGVILAKIDKVNDKLDDSENDMAGQLRKIVEQLRRQAESIGKLQQNKGQGDIRGQGNTEGQDNEPAQGQDQPIGQSPQARHSVHGTIPTRERRGESSLGGRRRGSRKN